MLIHPFPSVDDARRLSNAVEVYPYENGFIGKDAHGVWLHSRGSIAPGWTPDKDKVVYPDKLGYFVDDNGRVLCADIPPDGCHFVKEACRTHDEVWIVANDDDEVLGEYVLHRSLDELERIGVDIHYRSRVTMQADQSN